MLLMQAIRDGDIAASMHFVDSGRVRRNHWFLNLYAASRKLGLGEQDYEALKCMLEQAERAGVIDSVEPTLMAVELYLDLQQEVQVLRTALEKIMGTLLIVFIEQAKLRGELNGLYSEFKRYKQVQAFSQLVGVIFGFIPFAGASLASAFTGAGCVWEGMQTTNVVESALGAAGGGLKMTSDELARYFRFGAEKMLQCDSLPEEQALVLREAAAAIGKTLEELRVMIRNIICLNDRAAARHDEYVPEAVVNSLRALVSPMPRPVSSDHWRPVNSTRQYVLAFKYHKLILWVLVLFALSPPIWGVKSKHIYR